MQSWLFKPGNILRNRYVIPLMAFKVSLMGCWLTLVLSVLGIIVGWLIVEVGVINEKIEDMAFEQSLRKMILINYTMRYALFMIVGGIIGATTGIVITRLSWR